MTNNRHPNNGNVIASTVLLRQFAWNSLRMEFGPHIARSLDNSLQTPALHILLLRGTGLVDLRTCQMISVNLQFNWNLFLNSFIYRGAFNSSRRSAIWWGGAIPSPWRARYNVQKTPPPSQNFLGLRISSSSAGVLLAFLIFRPTRFPILNGKLVEMQIEFRHKETKNSIIYPLLSITSTGSSRICVTLGRVSSALSTGKVLDKKSSVRFRMSSLEWNCKINIWIGSVWINIDGAHSQWIWFAQDVLSHWISWNLSFVQITADIVNGYKCIFAGNIFAFKMNMSVRRWSDTGRDCWGRFHERIVSSMINDKWQWVCEIKFCNTELLCNVYPSGGSSSSICGSCDSTITALCKSTTTYWQETEKDLL